MEEFKNDMAEAAFGRRRKDGECVSCGVIVLGRRSFTNELSWKEYIISKMCETCQNDVFDDMDEEAYYPYIEDDNQ